MKVREAHTLQEMNRKFKREHAEYEAAIQALKVIILMIIAFTYDTFILSVSTNYSLLIIICGWQANKQVSYIYLNVFKLCIFLQLQYFLLEM